MQVIYYVHKRQVRKLQKKISLTATRRCTIQKAAIVGADELSHLVASSLGQKLAVASQTLAQIS